MAKERPIPHLRAIVEFLKSGTGDVPEGVKDDAKAARAALEDRRISAIAALGRDVQVAAAEALAAAGDVNALRTLEEQTAIKDVRKAVGKALHLLRTKGVDVGEGAVRGEGFRFHTVDGEQPRSFISLADPEGDRMIWFGTTVPNQGRMAFQAVCGEEGIALFQIFGQMTTKLRRRILEELSEGKIHVFEVENEYARWQIEQAVRTNRERGTEVPKEYFEAEPLMGSAVDLSSDPHPLYQALIQGGVSGEPSAAELKRGGELLQLEEISQWRPGGEIMDRLKKELIEAEEGVLVLDEAQQRERLQASVERAVREYFDEDKRALWLLRLQDLAMFLLEQRRGELARVALAAGEDLVAEGSDATLNPFASELFFKWLVREDEGESAQDEDAEGEDGEEEPETRIVTP